jgi:heme/copper-type cytochrome/quinol oxidase subunit 4
MKLLLDRISLVVIGLTSVYVGIFAYFATETWYATFPGFGLRWLPQLGPYNEHLAKDAGAAYLSFAVLSLVALAYVRRQVVVRLVGAALLTFNLLHFVYHLTMLHMYEPRDQVLNVLALGLTVVLSVVLVVPSRQAAG